MIHIPLPANIDGGALAAEMVAAGLPADTEVVVVDNELRINVGEEHRATAEQVAAAHVPPTPPEDPNVTLQKALEGATTVAALRDVLLGKTGPGVQARIR